MMPPFHPPPLPGTVVFVLIVLGVCGALVGATARATGRRGGLRMAAALGTWLLITALISGAGVLVDAPLRLVAFLATCNLLAIGTTLSPLGRVLARETPLWALIAIHGLRLPLEVVLHGWARAGTIPARMTWSGENFDILTGILALVVGLGVRAGVLGRRAALIFNGVGLVLLLNVIRVALRSTPGPLSAHPDEPPLLLVYTVPWGWIVPFCVSGALLGHLLLSRALALPPLLARG